MPPMRSRIILSMALGPKHVLMTSAIVCKSIWVCHCKMHAAHTPWQPWYLRSVSSSWTAFREKHLTCSCLINKSEWNTWQDSYSSQTLVSVACMSSKMSITREHLTADASMKVTWHVSHIQVTEETYSWLSFLLLCKWNTRDVVQVWCKENK